WRRCTSPIALKTSDVVEERATAQSYSGIGMCQAVGYDAWMRHAGTMHAQSVADAFGLGRATSLSDPVARGELGEIRRLEPDHGMLAVKQELDSRPVDDVDTSTEYHRVCWEAGIPTPEPLRARTGGFRAQVDGEQIRAYAWSELADPDPTLDPAAVGTL